MILVIGSQYVNDPSKDLEYDQERLFTTQLSSKESKDMINVLQCRFEQCLGTFTILLVEGSSEMGFFRHLYNHVFGVHNFRNTKSMRIIFFFKMLKI